MPAGSIQLKSASSIFSAAALSPLTSALVSASSALTTSLGGAVCARIAATCATPAMSAIAKTLFMCGCSLVKKTGFNSLRSPGELNLVSYDRPRTIPPLRHVRHAGRRELHDVPEESFEDGHKKPGSILQIGRAHV